MSFELTKKQQEAQVLIASNATHVLLGGGSRSGKTFLHCRNIAMRALKAPGSRHAMLRFRFNHIKASIILDTFPKVMRKAFPQVPYNINKSDWYAEFPNGSQIWFGGLDEKERTEKILGQEYATILLNEASQISYESYQMALTRLAQKVDQNVLNRDNSELKLRVWLDENPPTKGHWTYKLFVQKIDPVSRKPLENPEDYAYMKMNPEDNKENLPPGYFKILDSLSTRQRMRFRDGEFAEDNPNALFDDIVIDKYRVTQGELPEMARVAIGIDPAVTSSEESSDTGIVVAGKGIDGHGYVFGDFSMHSKPEKWGRRAIHLFDIHQCDRIIGEVNNGGDLIESVLRNIDRTIPYRAVRASRGKLTRAEPISALYEQGLIHHVGTFSELEDQMCSYDGDPSKKSPDRMDALVWVLTDLFARGSVDVEGFELGARLTTVDGHLGSAVSEEDDEDEFAVLSSIGYLE